MALCPRDAVKAWCATIRRHDQNASRRGASRPGGPGCECLSVQLVPRHGTPHQTKVTVVTTPFASAAASWSEWKKLRVHHQTFQNVCSVWTCGCTANRVNVFEIAVALPGRSELCLVAATPCRLQLCAVSGSSAGKLAALN